MQSSDFFSITSGQIRAARALLRWSAEDLAKRAHIGVATVRRAESQDGAISATQANAQAMRRALEDAGVVFESREGRHGVLIAEHIVPVQAGGSNAPENSLMLSAEQHAAFGAAGDAPQRGRRMIDLSESEPTETPKVQRKPRKMEI